MSKIRTKINEALLSDLPPIKDGRKSWLNAFRRKARERFYKIGVPIQKDEEWRLSYPQYFTKPTVLKSKVKKDCTVTPFDQMDRTILVFVDGVYKEEDSVLRHDNIDISHIGEIAEIENHWTKEIYGVLEEESQVISKRPLAALNSALADSGFAINIEKGAVDKPIEFRYIFTGSKIGKLIRNIVKVGDESEVNIFENFLGSGWSNILTEIDIGKNAKCNHFRSKNLSANATSNTFIIGRVEANSQFKSSSISLGGGKNRNECHVTLAGEFSSCSIAGASYLCEGDALDDDTISVHHKVANCKSRQVFKKVQKDDCIGVFQGKIRVEKEAQKTDGYQTSRAILLDDSSKFYAKPELEIFADDVSCSHGSVSGAIDQDSLFYLQSRGIGETQAKHMLILAFLSEVFDEIENEKIKNIITNHLENYLNI